MTMIIMYGKVGKHMQWTFIIWGWGLKGPYFPTLTQVKTHDLWPHKLQLRLYHEISNTATKRRKRTKLDFPESLSSSYGVFNDNHSYYTIAGNIDFTCKNGVQHHIRQIWCVRSAEHGTRRMLCMHGLYPIKPKPTCYHHLTFRLTCTISIQQ